MAFFTNKRDYVTEIHRGLYYMMPMTLDDFLMQIDQITDPTALNDALMTALEHEGAMCAVGFNLPVTAVAHDNSWPVLINTFPKAFSEYYMENCVARDDPYLDAALTLGKPVQFSEVAVSKSFGPRLKELWTIARECGLSDGLAMPIVHRPGCMTYFAIGFAEHRDMPRAWRRRIHILLEEYCVRYSAISVKPGYDIFTPRERQVLAGVVNGKSNTIIATNLGLSDHTVATYIKRAFAKLGTKTRLETTLKLVGLSDTSTIESLLNDRSLSKAVA